MRDRVFDQIDAFELDHFVVDVLHAHVSENLRSKEFLIAEQATGKQRQNVSSRCRTRP